MSNPVSEFVGQRERWRDIDDLSRRTVWGSLRYVNGAGAVMDVRGTDYVHQDVAVLWLGGYSFNLGNDANAEVLTLNPSSDTNQMVALPSLPRDTQKQWPVGSGGIQHPTNPDMFLQFSDDGMQVDIAGTTVTVAADGAVTIRSAGDVSIHGSTISLHSDSLTHNGVNIGEDHVHGGVDRGNSNTDGPQ